MESGRGTGAIPKPIRFPTKPAKKAAIEEYTKKAKASAELLQSYQNGKLPKVQLGQDPNRVRVGDIGYMPMLWKATVVEDMIDAATKHTAHGDAVVFEPREGPIPMQYCLWDDERQYRRAEQSILVGPLQRFKSSGLLPLFFNPVVVVSVTLTDEPPLVIVSAIKSEDLSLIHTRYKEAILKKGFAKQ